MIKWSLGALVISALCIFLSCKKSADVNTPFSITEVSDVQMNGRYIVYIPCDTSNYISVHVQVNQPGPWSLETDEMNGVKFSGSGTFSSAGAQVIKLFGSGTPNTSEKSSFKVQVGSKLASVSYVPQKTFIDIFLNNTNVQGYEAFYPTPSTWASVPEINVEVPTCHIYNVDEPNNNGRLYFENRIAALFPTTGTGEWAMYAPARLPVADINHPDEGFRIRLKNPDSYYELTSDLAINGDDQYVEIISRATFNINVATSSGMIQTPIYLVKVKFSAKLSDGSNQQTVSGTAILVFHSYQYI